MEKAGYGMIRKVNTAKNIEKPNLSFQVDIERLVLNGFRLTQREQRQLQLGMETELGRLLETNGLAANLLEGRTLPAIPAGGFEYRPGQNATELGRQIAQAVYKGIKP